MSIDFSQLAAPKPAPVWSPLQEAIFDFVQNETGSLQVNAVAGSGKTTTIVEAAKRISTNDNAAFLAFNKAIATELGSRLPPFVEARTFNSIGFHAIRPHIDNPSPIGYKVNKHLRDVAKIDSKDPMYKDLCRLLKLGKANGYGCEGFPDNSAENWESLMRHSGVELKRGDTARALHWLERAYTRAVNDTTESDFDDQILFPVMYDWALPKYDVIFVDEDQDLSPLQHEFLYRMTHPGTRIIGVGDPAQAIYGFRGADSSSIQKMVKRFNMTTLPLSVTYRCRQIITQEAQQYVPEITCPEEYEVGEIADYDGYDYDETEDNEFARPPARFQDGDLIMCRMNYPLFEIGMWFLRQNEPCNLMSDLPYQLENFIKGFECKTKEQLETKLEAWYQEEKKDAEDAEQWGRLSFLEDRYKTLHVLMEGATTVRSVLNNLQRLTQGDRGPTIATIHKCKGLEADRAFLLKPDLIPSKYAKLPHQLEQEDNLMYVAITRAKYHFGRVHIYDK